MMSNQSLEEKVSEPTPYSSFALSSLVGAVWEYFVPGVNLMHRLFRALVYGALVPLADKVLYPKVPLRKLYLRNAPVDALGSLSGQYTTAFARELFF